MNKILVTYASQFGSTKEVAEVIAEVLAQENTIVEAKWIREVKDLEGYNAVVVGSAIQYDRWMPEARQFVATHQDTLSKLPVAFFFTCLTLSKKTPKSNRQAMGYAEKLKALLSHSKPLSIGRFAGVLNYSKMPFVFRLVARVFLSILGVREGDHRDWNAIRSWAENVGSMFSQT